MANPVWVLSVDLQTKTATFQSGLADAAKTARNSFGDIKSGAGDMGSRVNYSMGEARHGIMLLGEEFGIHLPRALTSFIASVGPIGAAMEAAFPFLAIAVGATLLIEKLVKMQEAGQKLTEDQMKFGTTVNNAFNSLNDKLLQAEIKSDELNHDHLGALAKQLELIDHQSLNELVHSFEEVARAANVVMKDLEGHWYSFGKGSEGAKHALDDFQAHYDLLISQGKSEEASGLLHGTLAQAGKVKSLLDVVSGRTTGFEKDGDAEKNAKAFAAQEQLNRMGVTVGVTIAKQVEAQQNLVDALNAQIHAEQTISEIKHVEGANVKKQDQNADDQYAKEQARKQEEALKAGRELYMSELLAGNKEKVSAVQQGEREQIEATRGGSIERLHAVQAAMQAEQEMGLTYTAFYRDLRNQEIETQRQVDEQIKKLDREAKAEQIRQDETVDLLRASNQYQTAMMRLSLVRDSERQRTALEISAADEQFEIKKHALDAEIQALVQTDADYLNKLKQLNDKETILVQQHENEITDIKQKAEQERNQRILSADTHMRDTIASGLTSSIMGHQTWAKMIISLGDQVATSMIENAIKSILADDMTKERDAAKAARKAFNYGMELPFPANIIAAPVLAAGAFAAVMAFSQGGIVPGAGNLDTVPAMLTPGETVLPKELSEGLQAAAKGGGMGGGPKYHVTTHVHMHASALDADGMDEVLEKHADRFQKHFEKTLRRMNN